MFKKRRVSAPKWDDKKQTEKTKIEAEKEKQEKSEGKRRRWEKKDAGM